MFDRRTLLLIMFCLSCASPPRTAPAARQLDDWLTVFNAADREALLAYHARSFPYDRATPNVGDIDRELLLASYTGGFEVQRAEPSTPTRAVAILKERDSDRLARVVMEVEPDAPHRVRHFEIGPLPGPPVPRMTEAAALDALRTRIAAEVARDRFAGAVLVARHGTPIFAQAYGYADRAHQVPNTLDTHFRIGSMNKMFTAAAILRLVEDGQLAVTDTLGHVLPSYPNQTAAAKLTLHHLLTHTGGTGDIFGPEFVAHRGEIRTLQDYVALYGQRDLAFEPGARWEYSNYGFLLLGVIIEAITHKTYYDAVQALVFAPAGMTATSSPIEAITHDPLRAVPYTHRAPKAPWTSSADELPYRASSAGGGDSTVGDLLRFANALASHQLLDAAHTALLTTAKVPTMGRRAYAYGFEDSTTNGVRCVGHNGGAPGQNGRLYLCDSGYTIVVLANVDPPAADRIADFINQRLPATAE